MLVCDGCHEPMKRPKYIATQLKYYDPARDMQLPQGMEGLGSSMAPLLSMIPRDAHSEEVLAHFDRLECMAKWAGEQGKEG